MRIIQKPTSWLGVRPSIWIVLLLFATIGWTYRETPNFEFLNYDDVPFVRDNGRLTGGLGLGNLAWAATANFGDVSRETEYWMPVTLVSRLVDVDLFGRNPAGHHAMSVLIHALNAVLVFLLVRSATGSVGVGAFTALIFGLHPLNVEATCWIAGRKDLLSGTFSLLALCTYLRFARAPTTGRYLAVLGLFALALMAKPSVVSLPLAFLLLDWWPSRRLFPTDGWGEPGAWRNALTVVVEKIPFLLIALLCSALTYVGQSDVGGVGGAMNASLGWRLAEGVLGYVTYLQKLVWPAGLCVLYPALTEQPDLSLVAAASLFLLLLLALAIRFVRVSRVPLFSWFWFIGLLLPLVGIIPFGRQSVADRYLYVAMLGPILFAVVAAHGLWRLLHGETWSRFTRIAGAGAVGCVVLLPLSLASHAQSLTWTNTRTVWEQALRVNPVNSFALQALGSQYSFDRRVIEAAMNLRMSLKVEPDNFETLRRFSAFLLGQRKYAAAGRYAERALRLYPSDIQTHDYIIDSLEKSGRREDARKARARRESVRGRLLVQSAQSLLAAREWALASGQLRLAARMQAEMDVYLRADARLLPPAMQIDFSPWLAESALDGPPPALRALMRGVILRLQNQRKVALDEFRSSLRLAPTADAKWWIAISLLEAGNRADAESMREDAAGDAPAERDFPLIWNRVNERLDPNAAPLPPSAEG